MEPYCEEVRDFFFRTREQLLRLEEMKEHEDFLRSRVMGLRVGNSPLASACGRDSSRMEAALVTLADYHQEMKRKNLEALHRVELAEELTMSLQNPLERRLIRARYLHGRKWEEIRRELYLSETHVHRLHRQAMEKMAPLYQVLKKEEIQ